MFMHSVLCAVRCTYADFVLNGTLGANGEVLTGNRRVRANDDALYIYDLITSTAASPLPSLARSRTPCRSFALDSFRCRESDLVSGLSAVLSDAAPGKSLRRQRERSEGDSNKLHGGERRCLLM